MPRFFISWDYFRSLALCSRRFRLAVLNANNWAGLDLLVDLPEYTTADVLRPVARLFALARSVTAGVPQLPSLACLPRERLVRWEGWHVTQPILEEDQLHVWESTRCCASYWHVLRGLGAARSCAIKCGGVQTRPTQICNHFSARNMMCGSVQAVATGCCSSFEAMGAAKFLSAHHAHVVQQSSGPVSRTDCHSG